MNQITLTQIIDSISSEKPKHSSLSAKEAKNKLWTKNQEQKFQEMLQNFGQDLGMIQCYFPERTHRQIKRKCKEIVNRLKDKFLKEDFLRRRERRKSFFDEEILQQKGSSSPKRKRTEQGFWEGEKLPKA